MFNPIEIRPAAPHDSPDIVRLVKELAGDEPCDLTEEFAREYLAFPGCGILLAQETAAGATSKTGRVLGMLSYSIRPNLFHAGNGCLIEELVVKGDARGRGVGGLLVDAILQIAESLGCEEISVSTMPDNTGAIRFYKSHGFEDEAVYLERHFQGK